MKEQDKARLHLAERLLNLALNELRNSSNEKLKFLEDRLTMTWASMAHTLDDVGRPNDLDLMEEDYNDRAFQEQAGRPCADDSRNPDPLGTNQD